MGKRWQVLDSHVIYAFVEAAMLGNFDSVSVRIIPNDVLDSVRQVAKKETFLGVAGQFTTTAARRTNPNMTTKRAEVFVVGFWHLHATSDRMTGHDVGWARCS